MVDVLVVGAGPVGLTMAAELARHGVQCRIVDQLEKPSPYCRAIGVTPRTLEVWDDMGIAREMIDAGLWIDGLRLIVHGRPPDDTHHDLSDLPYSQLGLPQYETERLLTRHLGRLGIAVDRGTGLHSLQHGDKGVSARLERSDGSTEDAAFRYVIGCDGAHSTVRHALGIAFEGEAIPMSFMLGDVHIDWDLPRGRALRAWRLVENSVPDMIVAVPLPEPGRYRVAMNAPAGLTQNGGSGHGIQSEVHGPALGEIQAVADSLIPDKPRLSDLRWSSMFRISMRLATHYRRGRVFLAGDAAHIHPPTGGQGMNTGIQDAYNLAWKLALVLGGTASEELLDSYEAERRPVGADVVARTRAANEGHGRESKPDRLADTQVRVSYNRTAWVRDDAGPVDDGPVDAGPVAGDRAPDVTGLRRRGIGFPVRLFDILRGTEHVLLVRAGHEEAPELAAFARKIPSRSGMPLRIVGIVQEEGVDDQAGIALYRDAENAFARTYGSAAAAFLIRPDGYIGWRGKSYRDAGLVTYVDRVVG